MLLLPHAVSLLRPFLGVLLLTRVSTLGDSIVVLPIVLLACASDWMDGQLARRNSTPTRVGRLLDNLCDFAFLACLFAFLAQVELWSPPVWGRLVRNWSEANWFPLYALVASFGFYFVRLGLDMAAGREPERSPRGHAAGVCNYLLAVMSRMKLPERSVASWCV